MEASQPSTAALALPWCAGNSAPPWPRHLCTLASACQAVDATQRQGPWWPAIVTAHPCLRCRITCLMSPLCLPPAGRPRVHRRPAPHWQALLHERRGAALHPRGGAAAARVAAGVAAAAAVRAVAVPAAACALGGGGTRAAPSLAGRQGIPGLSPHPTTTDTFTFDSERLLLFGLPGRSHSLLHLLNRRSSPCVIYSNRERRACQKTVEALCHGRQAWQEDAAALACRIRLKEMWEQHA